MIPITEPQVQAILDAFVTFLAGRAGPFERIALIALQNAVDGTLLPAFWAYLQAQGIVSKAAK